MTSTMSLAARICSRVAEEIKPAMARAWFHRSGKSIRHAAAASSRGGGTPFSGTTELFVFGRGGLDEQRAKRVFDMRAGGGTLEDLLLERVKLRKKLVVVILNLISPVRRDF